MTDERLMTDLGVLMMDVRTHGRTTLVVKSLSRLKRRDSKISILKFYNLQGGVGVGS